VAKKLFFTQLGWQENSQNSIERNIKLFSLINTEVVIPSNHMYSNMAEFLFQNNPELLEYRILRPAMSDEYKSFSEYFNDREMKAGRNLSKYGVYLDSLDCKPLFYESSYPAQIFTSNAIGQLQNPDSVVRKAAKINEKDATLFLENLLNKQKDSNGFILFRDFLKLTKESFRNETYDVLERYAYLLRYISGASSKKCNNLLPQENLIDWCLANLDDNKAFILQDEQIFWEVFLESLVKLSEGIFTLKDIEKLSFDTIDRFSYTDIYELRNDCILQNKFISKYDSIINSVNALSVDSFNRTELMNFEALISLKERLRAKFYNSMKEEISIYHKIEIIEALVKIVYQLWGGPIQSINSVINFFSIHINKKQNWSKFLINQQRRVTIAQNFAKKRLGKETVLIDYMNMIVTKTKEAWYK